MIPYDDLVAALQAWRARQGLPVSTTQQPASAPGAATPSNGMRARQGTPPAAPPTPPRATTRPRMPLPLAAVDTADEPLDSLEVEDSSLIEENHYENEGDDFAMSFGGKAAGRGNGHGHATSTGDDETVVGEDVPEATDPARTHNTREDW